MKVSSHTIVVEDYPQCGEHLVYSTRTQALVKIDQRVKDAMEALETEGSRSFESEEDLNRLHKMGILVKDEQEEREKLSHFLNQLKYGYDNSTFVATILTTYACNLKCVYCFEESSRENTRLDAEAQKLSVEWLKRRIERLGYKGLLLNFYGGEPLLNTQAIEYIAGEMKPWCESKKIRFGMSLQTNGYLLTPEIVDRLKILGLLRVRISMDGLQETHDKNRPQRGGGGSFETIVKNIVACVDKISISISVAYIKDRIDPIKDLIEFFDGLGILSKLGNFHCSPINPTLGPKGNPEAIQGAACMCNHEDTVMASATRKIKALMESYDLKYEMGMSTNTCSLVRENSGVTIDQHGQIYRCNSLLGHPEFAIGDVRKDTFNETQKMFRDLDVWQQCPTDCTYLPMCSGGCRLMSFVGGHKNFKIPSCKKPYLNEMAPEFIKRDYDRLVANKSKRSTEPAPA